MPITGWPSDSATHPRQLLECERSTSTGRPSGDRGWFRTELQLRPQDGKPRYAVRSPTSSVAPALSRPLSEGTDTMTTISAWGTNSFCGELTGDFGGVFEATSIDGCRLFCRLAEIQSHGVLGLLQHYPPEAVVQCYSFCE